MSKNKPMRRHLANMLRKGGERTQALMAGNMVSIWSDEHGAYWRENALGYTDGKAAKIWVLPFEEAFSQTCGLGPEKKIIFEVVTKSL